MDDLLAAMVAEDSEPGEAAPKRGGFKGKRRSPRQSGLFHRKSDQVKKPLSSKRQAEFDVKQGHSDVMKAARDIERASHERVHVAVRETEAARVELKKQVLHCKRHCITVTKESRKNYDDLLPVQQEARRTAFLEYFRALTKKMRMSTAAALKAINLAEAYWNETYKDTGTSHTHTHSRHTHTHTHALFCLLFGCLVWFNSVFILMRVCVVICSDRHGVERRIGGEGGGHHPRRTREHAEEVDTPVSSPWCGRCRWRRVNEGAPSYLHGSRDHTPDGWKAGQPEESHGPGHRQPHQEPHCPRPGGK